MACIWLIILVTIILFLLKNDGNKKKYNLCIMAIFKNEEDYLEEWLQHHIKQGFDHFFLYCNDPNIKKYTYLDKYKKYITLIDWTNKVNDPIKLYNSIQRQAYYHCVTKYKNKCRFLMMLDIDEFVVSTNKDNFDKFNNYNLSQFIRNNYTPNLKAIRFQRYNFGSSGHIDKPHGGVLKNYNMREKICSSYKTLINTDYLDNTKKFYGVHDFNYIDKPGKIYNDYLHYNNDSLPGRCNANSINEIPFVINHYYTKSKKEYIERCKMWNKGGVNPVAFRKDCEKTFKTNDVNEVKSF